MKIAKHGKRADPRLRQQGIRSPFPVSPQGKSRGGMVPPTPGTLRASQPRWHASMHRLPPQEGSAPLRNPPGLTSPDVLPPPGRSGGELMMRGKI
jgi:hypothetical protein